MNLKMWLKRIFLAIFLLDWQPLISTLQDANESRLFKKMLKQKRQSNKEEKNETKHTN